ncbi:MAG: DNA mismatch repair endonuclease MutL [Thermodesulfobacteriota bacterium]
MPKIQILPEILTNKIAAGEVVERPASVAKELIENAIDAESAKIIVEIENGGRSLIRVADNGVGMSRDEALLSLERYATSKIRTDQDLFRISTLGFRGEALPSIAAVSRLEMITRDAASETGTAVQVEGGRIKQVTAVGAPVGTMISVRHLFYNTPARRKFLKSGQTEMGHLAETVAAIALGCPGIHFRLIHNERPLKSWPLSADPLERVLSVLGHDLRHDLHAIRAETPSAAVRGWISSPELTRSSSQKTYVYVNGRYIRDRGLQHALFEGYRGRLMKGRFPVAVIFIEVPFDQLDVNVHPTKHEVRFSGYQTVYDLLKQAVTDVWARAARPPWQRQPSPVPGSVESGKRFPSPASVHDCRTGAENAFPLPAGKPEGFPHCTAADSSPPAVSERLPSYGGGRNGIEFPEPSPALNPSRREPAPVKPQQTLWEKPESVSFRVIGQAHNTYIICESDEGVILVDQHAAHERILFEQLKAGAESARPAVQRLLMPEIIDLGYKEAAILEQLLPDLQQNGLAIDPFGGRSFAVKSAPALIADREMRPLILAMIDRVADVGFSRGMEAVMDECRILMACHGALRAHQRLSEKEMDHLIRQLEQCGNPSHCPHGRPIWIRWSLPSLEKLFKRIV